MKDFLLICDKNCATYKEMFPLFKQGIVSFGSPVKEYDGTDRKFGNHSWITTFPVTNKKKLVLTATYDPALYPKYDNYDAIEVSRVKDIPYDYDGVMGVPITILDHNLDNVEVLKCLNDNTPDTRTPTINGKEKYTRVLIKKNYSPEQFEVVGGSMFDDTSIRIVKNYTDDGYKFLKNDGVTESGSGALRDKTSPKIPGKYGTDYSVSPDGKFLTAIYQRIFIRRKK